MPSNADVRALINDLAKRHKLTDLETQALGLVDEVEALERTLDRERAQRAALQKELDTVGAELDRQRLQRLGVDTLLDEIHRLTDRNRLDLGQPRTSSDVAELFGRIARVEKSDDDPSRGE